MTFNLPNLREAKPAAMSAARLNSASQASRSSTSTRQSDASSIDGKKEAQVAWAEVSEKDSKTKKSTMSRIVQGEFKTCWYQCCVANRVDSNQRH